MNVTTSPAQKPPSQLQPLGARIPTKPERSKLLLPIALALLVLIIIVSAYSMFHSTGITIDLP